MHELLPVPEDVHASNPTTLDLWPSGQDNRHSVGNGLVRSLTRYRSVRFVKQPSQVSHSSVKFCMPELLKHVDVEGMPEDMHHLPRRQAGRFTMILRCLQGLNVSRSPDKSPTPISACKDVVNRKLFLQRAVL